MAVKKVVSATKECILTKHKVFLCILINNTQNNVNKMGSNLLEGVLKGLNKFFL